MRISQSWLRSYSSKMQPSEWKWLSACVATSSTVKFSVVVMFYAQHTFQAFFAVASSTKRLPLTIYTDTPRVVMLRAPLSKMYLGTGYIMSAWSSFSLMPTENPFKQTPGSCRQSLFGSTALANVLAPSNSIPPPWITDGPNTFRGGEPRILLCVLNMNDHEWKGLTGLAAWQTKVNASSYKQKTSWWVQNLSYYGIVHR